MNLWLKIALEYTPFDAELAELMSAAVLRRIETVTQSISDLLRDADRQADTLAQVLSRVRT